MCMKIMSAKRRHASYTHHCGALKKTDETRIKRTNYINIKKGIKNETKI